MRPKERRDSGQSDFFKAQLDQIVAMSHPLAKLATTIDWRFLEERFRGGLHGQAAIGRILDREGRWVYARQKASRG